jgi:hypothetical protein
LSTRSISARCEIVQTWGDFDRSDDLVDVLLLLLLLEDLSLGVQ